MDFLVATHSGIRWLVLLGLVVTVVVGFIRSSGGASPSDRWLSAVAILFDIQVLIGIILYFVNRGWEQGGFIGLFHPLAMLAAIAVFHIGLARGRRAEGGAGWRSLAVMTLVSLLLVLAAVPWQRGMI